MKDYFKYISPNEEDKEWGFHINVTGISQVQPNSEYPLSEHPTGYYFSWNSGRILNEYQLLYIIQGNGVLETKDGSYDVHTGSIIILVPGKWHRYRPNKNSGWTEYCIGFEGDIARHFMSTEILNANIPVIHCGLHEEILNCYNQAFDITQKAKPGYQQIVSGVTIQLIGLILFHIKNKEFIGKPIETIIEKTRQYLHDNFSKEIDLEKLATRNNIGYSYYRKMFKKFTGISPGQYLLQLRISKAKELIITTDQNIKEIALATGFDTIYYFSRVFKEKTGKTPIELRNNVLKPVESFEI